METNYASSTTSNDSGAYSVPQLREGAYSLTAKAAGFRDFRAENIVLAARDIRRVDAVISVHVPRVDAHRLELHEACSTGVSELMYRRSERQPKA